MQADELPNVLFPLLPESKDSSPLLAYAVRELTPISARRAPASRSRACGYDTLDLIAERDSRGWSLVNVVFTVDQ